MVKDLPQFLIQLLVLVGGGWLIHIHKDLRSDILPLMAAVVFAAIGSKLSNGNGQLPRQKPPGPGG